mmetsp:Transcript_52185/g.113666  ORF Transcript_52185/g.113666 Transcript_52185/m.113666 type:complete len:176 (-) Transcript_52185:404-931(-)
MMQHRSLLAEEQTSLQQLAALRGASIERIRMERSDFLSASEAACQKEAEACAENRTELRQMKQQQRRLQLQTTRREASWSEHLGRLRQKVLTSEEAALSEWEQAAEARHKASEMTDSVELSSEELSEDRCEAQRLKRELKSLKQTGHRLQEQLELCHREAQKLYKELIECKDRPL